MAEGKAKSAMVGIRLDANDAALFAACREEMSRRVDLLTLRDSDLLRMAIRSLARELAVGKTPAGWPNPEEDGPGLFQDPQPETGGDDLVAERLDEFATDNGAQRAQKPAKKKSPGRKKRS